MTPKNNITALIITYNEIGYIERCIESIGFADEIIVVDSFSTDGTYEYLLSHKKVKVVQRPFKNYTDQKAFALQQANYDWILFVDADEVVNAQLKEEILQTIANKNAAEAYYFYRQFMYQGAPLHFSGWQTDKNHRLFRKSKVKFVDNKLVHESLDVNGTSKSLKTKLEHYCFKNFDDYKRKMLCYGQLQAQERLQKGETSSVLKLLIKPIWRFTYNFVCRFGFLDGTKGLKVCYLNALSVYHRYAQLHRLRQNLNVKPYGSFGKERNYAIGKESVIS